MRSGLNLKKLKADFDHHCFRECLRLASHAATRDEIPVGAVLAFDGKIIAKAFNQTERHGHFMAHAEMLVLQKACRKLKTKYLLDTCLYISLEPCLMCYTAARLARVGEIRFLASSSKYGRRGAAYPKIKILKPQAARTQQVEESANLLGAFFKQKR